MTALADDPTWWACTPCDVRWKGPSATECWCCGASPVGSMPPYFPGYSGMGLFGLMA